MIKSGHELVDSIFAQAEKTCDEYLLEHKEITTPEYERAFKEGYTAQTLKSILATYFSLAPEDLTDKILKMYGFYNCKIQEPLDRLGESGNK